MMMRGALWTLLLTGSLLASTPDGGAQTGADTANQRRDRQPDSDNVCPGVSAAGCCQPSNARRGCRSGEQTVLTLSSAHGRRSAAVLEQSQRTAAARRSEDIPALCRPHGRADRSRLLACQWVPASRVQRSRDLSNYAVFTLVGAAAGSYAFGKWTGNEHLGETGFLSGEAALNSTLIAYAFKEATQRQRPFEGNGSGRFWQAAVRSHRSTPPSRGRWPASSRMNIPAL